MSATGRGAVRDPDDAYLTPPWCVHRLLEALELPGGLWLEPSAGEGNIMRAVAEVRDDVVWHAVEYRNKCIHRLDAVPSCHTAVEGNFLAIVPGPPNPRYAACVGNPPYVRALQHVQHAMRFAPLVVMLLRLNWLASDKRAKWMRANTPSLFVLPDRPSFTGEGGDATDYAWMVWGLPPPATVTILGRTPLAERKAYAELMTRGPREAAQLQLQLELA